jgi:hypothetical protein
MPGAALRNQTMPSGKRGIWWSVRVRETLTKAGRGSGGGQQYDQAGADLILNRPFMADQLLLNDK